MAKLKTISLFTGIGGLDFGFEAAGFETRVALEIDRYCCRTVRLNRPWEVIEGDINEVTSATVLERAGLEVGEADMLIGGPPCQPFSKSSYWVRGDALRLDDPRADTLTGYLRILRDALPRAFLLENVYGLAYEGKDEGLRYILDGIAQINRATGANYKVAWKIINTAEHGVPQIRERVFMVGSREGQEFRFPEAAFASPDELKDDLFTKLSPTARRGTLSAISRSLTAKACGSAANGAISCRRSPRVKTTSGIRIAAAGSPSLAGARAIGASC